MSTSIKTTGPLIQRRSIDERRTDGRLLNQSRLYVQIAHSREDLSLRGQTFASSTIDISPKGLRLRVDPPVMMGCGLDLWVNIEGHHGKFFLHGVVKWSMPSNKGADYLIGIELVDAPKTDHQKWQNWLSKFVKNY